MKKEWFFFPLGILFKAVGGIPVNRGRKSSLVEQMAEVFAKRPKFHLAITPEGTRKRNPNWKKGFYYIALKAQVPIVLIGIDYNTKTVTSTKAIMPSGDIEKDMREIKLYFKDFKGKHPENFSIQHEQPAISRTGFRYHAPESQKLCHRISFVIGREFHL